MTNVTVDHFKKILVQTNDYLKNVPRRIQELKNEIQMYNDEVIDIQHYIELSENKNASEGYLIYKQLKEVLCKRRQVKDELEYLEMIEKRMKNTFKHQEGLIMIVDGLEEKQNMMQQRTYTPRVRKELFNEIHNN